MNAPTTKAPTNVEALTDRNNANTEHHDTGREAKRVRFFDPFTNELLEPNADPDAERKAGRVLIEFPPLQVVRRQLGQELDAADARAARARRRAAKRWDALCQEYRLVCAADEDVLEAWLPPLDEGFDWSGFDFGEEFEMPSQRVWNEATEEGLMHVDDDHDDRVILFVRVDDATGMLFAAEHLAAHPGVRATPAHPDMPLHPLIDHEQGVRIKGLSRALDDVGVGFANVVGLPAGCFWDEIQIWEAVE